MSDPPRLFESDPAARDAIDAARSDMPDAKRLAKIGAAAAAAATATAATTASAGTALAVKIIAGVVFLGAAVGVGAYVNSTRDVPPAASASGSNAATASGGDSGYGSDAATASENSYGSNAATASAPAQALRPSAPPPLDELTTLDEAQRVLPTDPAKALSLCNNDVAANPKGSMAQEREVIAIDALMRLKRQDEAAKRAQRFHATWPDSAHGRRVDALVNLH